MTTGRVGSGQAGELHGYDPVAEQSEHPTDGACEPGGSSPPALGLGPLDRGSHLSESIHEQLGNIVRRHVLDGVDVALAVDLTYFEVIGGQAFAAREPECRLRGIPFLIERDVG